jgi:membrane-associated phospholipid phosphatase
MQSVALVLQTSPLMLTVVLALLAFSLHWVRELRVLLLLVVLSSVLNVGLKALVRQARPGPSPANCAAMPCWGKCTAFSFGMPSGHSQFSAAVATYLLLAIYSQPGCVLVRGLATLLCLALLIGVPFSRTHTAQDWQLGPVGAYSTGCHSLAQVLVGSAVGAALGAIAWHWTEEED